MKNRRAPAKLNVEDSSANQLPFASNLLNNNSPTSVGNEASMAAMMKQQMELTMNLQRNMMIQSQKLEEEKRKLEEQRKMDELKLDVKRLELMLALKTQQTENRGSIKARVGHGQSMGSVKARIGHSSGSVKDRIGPINAMIDNSDNNSEEDPRSAVKRKRNSLDAPDLNKWTVIHSQRDEAVTREFVSSLIKVTPSLGMKWSKPRMVSLPDHKPSSYETALDQVLAQNPQIVMAVIPANKGDHYSIIKKKCSLERPISPIPSQVVRSATLISQARGLMSVATKVAVQMNNKLGGGGETLPPELILTNITEHGPRPAAARVTWDRGNTGDTYDWKRQRKRHRGEEEDEDVVVSETSDEED